MKFRRPHDPLAGACVTVNVLATACLLLATLTGACLTVNSHWRCFFCCFVLAGAACCSICSIFRMVSLPKLASEATAASVRAYWRCGFNWSRSRLCVGCKNVKRPFVRIRTNGGVLCQRRKLPCKRPRLNNRLHPEELEVRQVVAPQVATAKQRDFQGFLPMPGRHFCRDPTKGFLSVLCPPRSRA